MLQDVLLLPAPGSAFLDGILQIADKGVIIRDASEKIIYCNPSAERILGASADRILGRYNLDVEPATIHEDGSPFPADDYPIKRTLKTGEPCSGVVMGLDWGPNAPRTWLSINSAIIPPTAGEPVRAFSIFADISRHVEAKRQLSEVAAALQQTNCALLKTQTMMRNLMQTIPDQVWLKDPDGVYIFCNSALARLFAVTQSEVVGKTDDHFSPPAQAEKFRQRDQEAARSGKPLITEETVCFLQNPQPAVLETVRAPMHDEDGQFIGVLGIARDVTERRELQEKLRQSNSELKELTEELQSLVRTDSLSGLPNRRAFEEAIGRNFRRFKRSGAVSSVLMIDIDHFKRVNDRYGHNAGDAALIVIADAFRANCRAADTAARLGGEEFALLLPDTPMNAALLIAERLRDEVQRAEVSLDSIRFSVTISIGVSSFLPPDDEWPQVLGRADAAMYAAKAAGRNRVCDDRHVGWAEEAKIPAKRSYVGKPPEGEPQGKPIETPAVMGFFNPTAGR